MTVAFLGVAKLVAVNQARFHLSSVSWIRALRWTIGGMFRIAFAKRICCLVTRIVRRRRQLLAIRLLFGHNWTRIRRPG